MINIYCLKDPDTDEVFYSSQVIGQRSLLRPRSASHRTPVLGSERVSGPTSLKKLVGPLTKAGVKQRRK